MKSPTFLDQFFESLWSSPWQLWALFLVLAICVIITAYFLPRFVLELFKRTKINILVVGLVFLSLITSLPEGLSTIFSVILNNDGTSSGWKAGFSQSFSNIVGANFFSGTALIVLDFVFFRYYYLNEIRFRNKLTLLVVIIINALILLLLLFPTVLEWRFKSVSITAMLFLMLYFVYVFILFRLENKSVLKNKLNPTPAEKYFTFYINPQFVILLVVLLIVILLGTFFVFSNLGRFLKSKYGFPQQSVGGLFFAITTAFPELLGCISLFNLKLANVAISVIFGSHFFNLILFIASNLYFGQPTFQFLSEDIKNIKLMALTLISSGLFFMHILFQDVKPRPTYFIVPLMILMLYLIGWTKIM